MNDIATKSFWRVAAALAFALLTTSLMNIVVFPRFDEVFTYARDVSVLANSLVLIAIGLAATFKPALLPTRTLLRASVACLALGAAGLPLGLWTGNAVLLTAAACLAAIGRSWVIVSVGIAASRLTLGQAGLAIALAFTAYYLMTAVAWVTPIQLGTALFLVLPFASLALTWREARPVLDASEGGEAPIDFSVTQPASFLPLVSQLFVCLFLFRLAFGYALRFGETGGVPLSDFLVIVPVAAVAVYLLVSRRAFPADLLTQLSVLCVVAGFLFVPVTSEYTLVGSVTLLSAGNTMFDMVAWLALVAIASRNERGALATFAWGRGITGLGTVVGAALGVFANNLFGSDGFGMQLMTGGLILVFVGYALIGLKRFSFAETIEGVTPVETTIAKTPEDDFNERCTAIAGECGLSPRELEVFMMLARGRNREYIQEQLVVSRNTVKAHVKHVYAKLDIHTHQELIDLVEAGV